MAVKQFIDNYPNIKLAVNYHSFGNILIVPFNYLKRSSDNNKGILNIEIQKKFPEESKIYQDIISDSDLPRNILIGNSYSILG
jgi:hypothetical protein